MKIKSRFERFGGDKGSVTVENEHVARDMLLDKILCLHDSVTRTEKLLLLDGLESATEVLDDHFTLEARNQANILDAGVDGRVGDPIYHRFEQNLGENLRL